MQGICWPNSGGRLGKSQICKISGQERLTENSDVGTKALSIGRISFAARSLNFTLKAFQLIEMVSSRLSRIVRLT